VSKVGLKLGSLSLDVPFFEASLSGYSDYNMRMFARRFGCVFALADVMLDKSVARAEILAKACFQPGDDEHPVGAQLLGKTPATMAKADGLVPAVMAASILAKVARDHLMDCLDTLMPEYGFRSHKGYPTKAHRKAIERCGPSRFHRQGFQLLPQPSSLLFDSFESED